MRTGHLVPALSLMLAAGCSGSEETRAPAVSADERRALAEARAMIPADEIAPEPTPEESSTP